MRLFVAESGIRVGFMRGAKMIALDSPDVLKKQTSSVTMEEVFLKLVKGEN